MHQVSIDKNFPVSAEQLYEAWTQPEALKQWWHPMGNQLIDVQNELEEGGKVQYVFNAGSQNEKIQVDGTYETVQPHQKLVYTWNWHLPQATVGNGHYKLTIGFNGNGNQSTLSVLQENFDSEEAIQPHREGWEQALKDLEHFLANKQ